MTKKLAPKGTPIKFTPTRIQEESVAQIVEYTGMTKQQFCRESLMVNITKWKRKMKEDV